MKDKFIMLVEDDSDHVALILRSLRRQGMLDDVLVMLDGEEALDFLFARGAFTGRDVSLMPAVVLLDLKLPKLNGLEVLERIRHDDRTRRLPVVVLTSSDNPEDMRESYRLGANSFVKKPADFRDFIDAIYQVIIYWVNLNQVPCRA
ncbi:MAG TPA: response regulator [Symbiobacteriaceae bacterium]|nr:response regulator [Symbiobacteriaceae bacterium]